MMLGTPRRPEARSEKDKPVTPPPDQRRIAHVLMGSLGVLLAALAGYLLFIQVYSAEALSDLASRQQHMRIPLIPQRGTIVDRGQRILAASIETPSIFADPKVIRDPSEAAAKLGPLLGENPDTIFRTLSEEQAKDPPSRFVWLARRVSPETAEAIRRLGVNGIGSVTEGIRHYPNGSLAAHVLGFVGGEEQGLGGLELQFNGRLAGQKGEAFILADRQRRPIWTEPDQFVPAVDGQTLVLTIDATIQAAAEEAIDETWKKFRAASVTAIVMEVATGNVLAMANVPTFDPNRYHEFKDDARRNRAVTDPSPPGSSCKPFFVASAIEEGYVRWGEQIDCENGYWAAARLHDTHAHGMMTPAQILEVSSNIGAAKIGARMGNANERAVLEAFGFGRKTGIWLPGESYGVVYTLPKWTSLSTTRIPIGQEFTATPIQLITAFAAIANHGKLLKPRIVRGVLDNRGESALEPVEPEVIGQAIDAKTARDLIDKALIGVVEEGTAKSAKIPGYTLFGKTGTAQKIDPETHTISKSRYMGALLCGAPAEDPKVVVLVMVDEPDKSLGYYGAAVAGPAVKKIMEQTLPYLGIPPKDTTAAPSGVRLVQQKVKGTR
jgi:cell division protein FtsI (penicillin-binding protein 3)